jgi:cytochrome P450
MHTSIQCAAAIRYQSNPFWGSIFELSKNPLEFMLNLGKKGPLVRFRMGPVQVVLASAPELVEQVLVTNARSYNKQTRGFDALRLALGNGLLTSEGDFWKSQRNIAQPAFHRQHISGFAATMTRLTEEMVEAWAHQPNPIDMHREMMRLTLRIVSLCLMSRDISEMADNMSKALSVGMAFLERRMFVPWAAPMWLPTPATLRARHALELLDSVVNSIIAERRLTSVDTDLLGMLMAARDEETKQGMTDKQLRDEVATLITAGHETTANALSWTLMLLSQHPEIEARARQEVSVATSGKTPGLAHLGSMPFVEAVIKESMRLYPPAWAIGRGVTEPTRLGEERMRPGEIVLISPWVTHRLPYLWPDPDRFDPSRFMQPASERHKLAYFPFAAGTRKCIGDVFAMMELKLVLAVVLQRAKLQLAEGRPVELEPVITLRPKNGLWMNAQPQPNWPNAS